MPQPSLDQRVYDRPHVILPSSAHFQSLNAARVPGSFLCLLFCPSFLASFFTLRLCSRMRFWMLYLCPCTVWCAQMFHSWLSEVRWKLLMGSIDLIPFRHQYLHISSCPGALSSAFASYSSGSPDQAAGIRKCWKNPLSMHWEYLAPHQQLHVSPMRNGHGLSQYTEEHAVISVYTSIL